MQFLHISKANHRALQGNLCILRHKMFKFKCILCKMKHLCSNACFFHSLTS